MDLGGIQIQVLQKQYCWLSIDVVEQCCLWYQTEHWWNISGDGHWCSTSVGEAKLQQTIGFEEAWVLVEQEYN